MQEIRARRHSTVKTRRLPVTIAPMPKASDMGEPKASQALQAAMRRFRAMHVVKMATTPFHMCGSISRVVKMATTLFHISVGKI